MLNERSYGSRAAAHAYLEGLAEVYDESILIIGLRAGAGAEFIAAFVDQGRDDDSAAMKEIFSTSELEDDRITGEMVVKRYLERYPDTEVFDETGGKREQS